MSTSECAREQDVLDAVASGCWPDRCDAEVVEHVAACPLCADVAEVARAVKEDHAAAWQEARVPSAALVWWRLKMRARQEAVRVAARPIALVQALAGALAVGTVLAVLTLAYPWLAQWVGVLRSEALRWALPLALVGATLPLLAPVVLYLALSDE